MTIITICPNCGREHEVDTDTLIVTCHYGGAFDGFNVTSDADPGL